MKLTRKDVETAFRKNGLVLKRTDFDEWKVNYRNGREATAYYTDSLEDAFQTGMQMLTTS